MHTIIVPLRAVDLGEVMTTMRRWLDEHEVQPSLFRYDNFGVGQLMMKLDFAACGDADAFAAAFCTHQRSGAAGRRRTPGCSVITDMRSPQPARGWSDPMATAA
jgi:hypothetical protein